MQLLIQLKAYQIIKNANQRHVPSRSSLTTEKRSAATFTGNRFPSDSFRPKPQVSPLVMLLVDLAHSNPAGPRPFWRWNRNHPAPKKVLVLENRRWRLWPRYWSKASSVFRLLIMTQLLIFFFFFIIIIITGWWYTYPSEKYESHLGPLFNIYSQYIYVEKWSKCSKPPTRSSWYRRKSQ